MHCYFLPFKKINPRIGEKRGFVISLNDPQPRVVNFLKDNA